MNFDNRAERLSLARFAVGQPVPRSEDPVLLRGEGRYTDDLNLAGQAYAAMVRSPYAHGVIRGIDAGEARALPGVLGVWSGRDLAAAGYGPLTSIAPFKNRDGSPMHKPPRPALAVDKVRFLGDPLAFVVAESRAAALAAAEAVAVDIEPLPAVTEARAALRPEAPQLYDEVPGNRALDYHYGDSEAVAAAFARAAHVTRLDLASNRVVVNALEPRAAIGRYEAESGRWILHAGSQGVFGMRGQLAEVLGVAPERVRVLTGNVGGSFGMKAAVYPEYVCLLHAARQLGRPVKWTEERAGSFLSDHHGRDIEVTGELALDAEGNFLAVRIAGYANLGAFLARVTPIMFTLNIVKNVVGVYRTPLVEVAVQCAFTNTTFVGPYRGAGRPDANYFMQRLIDTAAAEMELDPVDLRRRNHIRPEQLPYAAPSGMTYDSGDFTGVLERALAAADWEGFAARREDSRARGRLRGRGIGSFLEVTAPPNKEMGGLRFEADGSVTLITGTLDYGQGHAAPFAQVLSQRLGLPFERIRLLQGDSDELVFGAGTGGSRSMMMSGAAIAEAADLVIERGRQAAAFALEADAADIDFAEGRFTIVGTDRAIGLLELADWLRGQPRLAEGVPDSLDVRHVTEVVPSSFPNGCHVAEVEVDPETGVVAVAKYTMANDFGTIVNPLLVEGQLHGGVVQGIGQALLERTVYDADGQLLTGSFMDYALPRAGDAPAMDFLSHPVPATTNPLGVKGCGEAGCAGALGAVMNALVDALSVYGIRHLDMPATPERVWRAIRAAETGADRS